MNNWNDRTNLPDESQEIIWFHIGDGGSHLSAKSKKESWDEWFHMMTEVVGWLLLEAPVAPQPPTQKDLDQQAALEYWLRRGTAFARMQYAEIPAEWMDGWTAGIAHGRKE